MTLHKLGGCSVHSGAACSGSCMYLFTDEFITSFVNIELSHCGTMENTQYRMYILAVVITTLSYSVSIYAMMLISMKCDR